MTKPVECLLFGVQDNQLIIRIRLRIDLHRGCLPFTRRNRFVKGLCNGKQIKIPDAKLCSDWPLAIHLGSIAAALSLSPRAA